MRGILTIEPKIEDDTIRIPLNINWEQHSRKCEHLAVEIGSIAMKYLPGSTCDREAHSETNANVGPCVRADAVEDVFPSLIVAGEADLREHKFGHVSFFTKKLLLVFIIIINILFFNKKGEKY